MQVINFVKLLFERRCSFLSWYSVGGKWTIWTCNFGRLILVGKSRNTLRQNQTSAMLSNTNLGWTDLKSDRGLRGQTPEPNSLRHDIALFRQVFAKTGVSLWSCKQCALSGIGPVFQHDVGGTAAGSRNDERNLKKYSVTWWWGQEAYLSFVAKPNAINDNITHVATT